MELTQESLELFFDTVQPHLNERHRRLVAGALAEAFGHGGQTWVANASGMSTNTLWKAVGEIRDGVEVSDRQRRPGGGDKPKSEKQPGLLEALDELVHPETRGNPMSMLRWTSKSTYEAGRRTRAARASRSRPSTVRPPLAPPRLLAPGPRQAERGDASTPTATPSSAT